MTDRQELAIYDLDRTITLKGTYTAFLIHWASAKAPWRLAAAPAALAVMASYAAKKISRKRLKEIMQAMLMGKRVPKAALTPMVESFADKIVARGVYDQARQSIEADLAAGRRVILATASHEFYAAAIARRLNIGEVIATRSEWDETGALLPRIKGENCYGPSKLDMVKAFFEKAGLRRENVHIRFYSDHVSDLPVFDWSDLPLAVNSSPKLRKVAMERGWTIMDWSNG